MTGERDFPIGMTVNAGIMGFYYSCAGESCMKFIQYIYQVTIVTVNEMRYG